MIRVVTGFALLGALASVGCTSDETVICERLDECKLLPEGYSVDRCKQNVAAHVDDDRLDACAECVTGADCAEVQDECREDCRPIY